MSPEGKGRAPIRIAGVVSPELRREFFSEDSLASLERSAQLLGGRLQWWDFAEEFLSEVHRDDGRLASTPVVVSSWGFPCLDDALLDRLAGLKLLAHTGSSVRAMVGDSFFARGLHVTQAGDAMARPVAEVALTFTLSLLHRVQTFSQNLHGGMGFVDAQACAGPQREISGARIGVVGASRTGREYIALVTALGAKVTVYDPFLDEDDARLLGVEKAGLSDLMSRSDIVSVHAPTLPETHHMIDAGMLALLPTGAGLVNTARSWLVDERALIAEAATGRIDVAVDVFDREPFADDHPFRSMPNVLLTPHRAAGTINGRRRGGAIVAAEVRRHALGEPLEHEVSSAQMARMA